MKSLSEILLQHKIISTEELEHAVKIQDETGGLIGLILISLGYLSKDNLIEYILKDEYDKVLVSNLINT